MLLASVLLGCGAASSPVSPPVPARQQTPGDSLLHAVPSGVDLVLEIDLRRLRDNEIVGPLMALLTPPESIGTSDLLKHADAAIVCVYGIGDGAKQLVVVRSSAEVPGVRVLGPGLFAVGDSDLLARAEAVNAGAEAAANGDADFMRLRAAVMPEKAAAAAVRLVARLDFDARVSIAAKIEVSDVPVSIALWGDVVDDLAVIASLGVAQQHEVERLNQAMLKVRKSVASHVFIRQLGLAPAVQGARIIRTESGLRVLFVLSPKRLQLVVARIISQLASPQT